MELQQIIKNDQDRLFIISPECFIVFTGDSVEDEKPFIRIGNSLSLSPRIIPLIENIIITDLITGNPAHEQYNIDPRFLPSNRYIGSKLIVKRYLEFQKLFGLDLNNATIVDIEDIPQISKEQIISDRETFLGVFYTDSNFKILYNQKTLFDLKDIHQKYPSDVYVHNRLSEIAQAKRYAGTGFVVTNNAIMFYKNNAFSSVGMPLRYYGTFARLQIDPATIRDIIITSSSTMPCIPLIKWKHATEGRIRIFYTNDEEVSILQRLFNQCTLHYKESHSYSCDNPEGFTIQNIGSSQNCVITIKNVKPATKDVTLVYIHDPSEISLAINTEANLYIVDNAIYKKAAMLFTNIAPIAVINDLDKNIPVANIINCYPSLQYDIRYYTDSEKLNADMLNMCKKDIAIAIQDYNFNYLEKINYNELSLIENNTLYQILRLVSHTTDNRSIYKQCNSLITKLQRFISTPPPHDCKCICMLFDRYAYLVYEKNESSDSLFFDAVELINNEFTARTNTMPDMFTRIIEDRKRLELLLDLIYSKNTSMAKEAKAIEKAINKRKKEINETKSIDVSLIQREKLKKRLKTLKKIAAIAIAAVSAAAFLYGSFIAYSKYQEKRKREEHARYIEYLVNKYSIHVSDKDIFYYANEVAVKNGYSRIDIKSLKEKNPHWIYPGNRFVLLDGQVVLVKPGDTLWGISEKKLFTLNIDFYTLIDKLEKKIDNGLIDNELAQKALAAATHNRHKEIVDQLIKKMHSLEQKKQ